MALVDGDGRDRHHERQLGGREEGQRQPRLAVELVSIEQQRGHAAHDEEQRQEQRQLEQAQRILGQRTQVEVDPAHHEEEGDEEAVADGRELGLEDLHLVALERDADDHPGYETAQQQVEAERRRQRG